MPNLTPGDESLVSFFYDRIADSQAPAPADLPAAQAEFIRLTVETEQAATGQAQPPDFKRVWQQALNQAGEVLATAPLDSVGANPIPWTARKERAYWPVALVAGMTLAIVAGLVILLLVTQSSLNQTSATPTAFANNPPAPTPIPKASFNGLDLNYPGATALAVKPGRWPFNNPAEAIINSSKFAFGSQDTASTILAYYQQKLAGYADFQQPRSINPHQLQEGLVAFKGPSMLAINVFPATRRDYFKNSPTFFSLFRQLQPDQTLLLVTYGTAPTLPTLPEMVYPGAANLPEFDLSGWPELSEPFATYADFTMLRPRQTAFATGGDFVKVVNIYKNKFLGSGYKIIYDTANEVNSCDTGCQRDGGDVFIAYKEGRLAIVRVYSPARRSKFKPEEIQRLNAQGLKPDQTLVSYATGLYDVYFSGSRPIPDPRTAGLAWSPDGTVLAVSRDKEVTLWKDGTTLINVLDSFEAPVNRLAWSPDSQTLVTASGYGLQYWSAQGQKLASPPEKHTASIKLLAWSPDSKILASAAGCLNPSSSICDERVLLWGANGALLATLPGHKGSPNVVSWSPDGQQLATEQNDVNAGNGGNAGNVTIWSRQGGLVTILPAHPVSMANMAWSPSTTDKILATSLPSSRGILGAGIWLWYTEFSNSNSNIKKSLATFNDVTALAWSPDGTLLAVAETDNTVKLWRVADNLLLKTLNGPTAPITALAWSADGKTLATLSQDKTIRLWDSGGNLLKVLSGPPGQISSLAWSPDGLAIYGISTDKTLWLWHADSTLVGKLVLLSPDPAQVGWSPNGKTLAVYDSEGTVSLWDKSLYSLGDLGW